MMRFTVDARAFSDAMSKVSKVLRKSPLPILEEIAVCIQHGRCTLTATDLETWLVAEIPTLGDDMSFVLSRTKDVMKACSHFEGELAITLVFKDEKDGTLEVRCGQRAAEFSVSSHEDYPECGTVEDGTSLRVNAAALFRRIERVRYAAEKGCLDRRPQSACVQFREDRIFSLDGRRMACDTQPDTVFPVPCLMLGDALTHLRAFGENEVTVQIGAHKVCFSDETLKLYVRRYGVDTYDPDAAIPKAYREVTPMFFYPFSNVHDNERVCTGNNILPRYKKLSAMKNFPRYLLGLPDNDDMFYSAHNQKGLDHKALLEHLKDKDPSYYYTDILVPNGRTLSDFVLRR